MGGVYTRDVMSSQLCQSSFVSLHPPSVGRATASFSSHQSSVECCSEQTPVTDSITAVSSQSAAVSTSATTTHQSVSSQSHSHILHPSSLPVKTGILPPPTSNVSTNTSSAVSAVHLQSVNHSASQSVRQEEEWTEFEESSSSEFISFATSSTESSCQSKDAVLSSSYMPQQLKAPSLALRSTASFYTFILSF